LSLETVGSDKRVLTEARTGIIDDVYRAVSKCDDNSDKRDEGKKIVEEIARLKYEIQHDREITYVALLPAYLVTTHGSVATDQFATTATPT
jgi:hypothetical protein